VFFANIDIGAAKVASEQRPVEPAKRARQGIGGRPDEADIDNGQPRRAAILADRRALL